jgi:glycosyltransferase involved in cell wall biosynthesis
MSAARVRVCVVGSSTHFISGISYYTYFLASALRERHDVSVVLMRKLIPRRLYPGRDRVGAPISDLDVARLVPTFDGVDWYGLPSIWRAARFIRRQRPEIVIFQWWTGTVVVWYSILSAVVRRSGGRCIMELHEDLDTAESNVPVLAALVMWSLRRLLRSSVAYVVHSEHDAERMCASLGLPRDRVWVIPHGPYPMAASTGGSSAGVGPAGGADTVSAPVPARHVGPVRLLFFGTIRPYKGLEVLVDAFEQLVREDPDGWQLTVVGESWEGWTLPLDKIAASPFAHLITVRNRYVPDAELPDLFGQADLVVLPYLRASASGPLQLTMSAGLPVVVSEVGGLVESAASYDGATFAAPADSGALAEAIRRAAPMIGITHPDPHSWDRVAERFEGCFASLPKLS